MEVRPNGPKGPQTIEELQRRYQLLRDKKVAAETNHKNAQERLDQLKKEARARYGTDNVEELQLKLEAMQAENAAKRMQYQADLDRIVRDTERSARLHADDQRVSAWYEQILAGLRQIQDGKSGGDGKKPGG